MGLIAKIIRSLFCNHEWEFHDRLDLYEDYSLVPVKRYILYRCKKCGYIPKIKY